MKSMYQVLVIFLMPIILFSVFSCSDNSVTLPAATVDHLFYITSDNGSQLTVFDADRRKYIHYIPLDTGGYILDIIGDNQSLVIHINRTQESKILDVGTEEFTNSFGFGTWVSISPDSKYASVLRYDGSFLSYYTLEIQNLPGFGIIHLDSSVKACSFGIDSRYIAYIHETEDGHTGNILTVYDIVSDSILEKGYKSISGEILLEEAIPIENLNKVVCLGSAFADNVVFVYTIGNASIHALSYFPGSYTGDIAVGPEGKYLYLTMVPPNWYNPPDKLIYVFDLETEKHIKDISLESVDLQPNHMFISPDGKYMMVTSGPYSEGKAALIDLENSDVIGVYGPPGMLGPMAATLCPK